MSASVAAIASSRRGRRSRRAGFALLAAVMAFTAAVLAQRLAIPDPPAVVRGQSSAVPEIERRLAQATSGAPRVEAMDSVEHTTDAIRASSAEAVAGERLAPPSGLKLTGIVLGAGGTPSTAIIAGDGGQKLYAAGDMVDEATGATLRSIHADYVVLASAGRSETLRLTVEPASNSEQAQSSSERARLRLVEPEPQVSAAAARMLRPPEPPGTGAGKPNQPLRVADPLPPDDTASSRKPLRVVDSEPIPADAARAAPKEARTLLTKVDE